MSGKPQLLLIDNFDSFTYILKHYIEAQGYTVHVVRNDTPALNLVDNHYQGIIISPGPGTPTQSGNLLEFLNQIVGTLPILGICLGMQAIGEYYGLVLEHGSQPFHGKQTAVRHTAHRMFAHIPPQFFVGRYHSLVLKKNNESSFEITATSVEGELMAIAHRDMPIWGVQFHPESCMTEYGPQLIKNWCDLVNRYALQQKA